jgi:trigger factor
VREHARKVKLPGFRAGKVPPHVIRQRFRSQIFEEAAEAIINRVVPPEIEDRGLKPLAAPRVTDLKIDDAAPLHFRIVFEIMPLVELPEWRGLKVEARKAHVSEEQVDKELDALREQQARFDPVEGRPLQEGDFAVADVAWHPADGGKGGRDENAMIEVGGETNAALREALVGMSPGATKQVSYTPEATGGEPPRRIQYTLTVKAVKTKVVPGADDDFAKDVGDFETLTDLRADLRQKLLSTEERRVDREVKQRLTAELIKRASFELPETLVEHHMDARAQQAARALAMQGVDPRQVDVDWRQYREAQRPEAVEAAKADILLDELARRENVEAAPADIELEVARYARALRRPVESVRAQMEQEGELNALRARLRTERTLDLLKANARLEIE